MTQIGIARWCSGWSRNDCEQGAEVKGLLSRHPITFWNSWRITALLCLPTSFSNEELVLPRKSTYKLLISSVTASVKLSRMLILKPVAFLTYVYITSLKSRIDSRAHRLQFVSACLRALLAFSTTVLSYSWSISTYSNVLLSDLWYGTGAEGHDTTRAVVSQSEERRCWRSIEASGTKAKVSLTPTL